MSQGVVRRRLSLRGRLIVPRMARQAAVALRVSKYNSLKGGEILDHFLAGDGERCLRHSTKGVCRCVSVHVYIRIYVYAYVCLAPKTAATKRLTSKASMR